MANKQRGEVDATGQSGSTYLFKLGTGAICALEQQLDKPFLELFDELQQGKIRLVTVREFVKAASTTPLDDAGANAVIDDVGLMPVLAAMKDSLMTVFNATPENPQKPARKRTSGAGVSSPPPQ